MSEILVLSGYDISDEGPGRAVNEDATLVREDLGLFALADGAGGRGRGDLAATLALRSIENYIGASVTESLEQPDFDLLGSSLQARRLSSAIHRAHQHLIQVLEADEKREGMATTVVATLLSPRTRQLHIAHVGNSRCYRLRHGRLELLTVDHTLANEILERRPETPNEVLEKFTRNAVVCALGMKQPLRVSIKTIDLLPGDRFLLCTDGLTASITSGTIRGTLRQPEAASVISSELLSYALAARTQDNVSILVMDCREQLLDEHLETRRYNEIPNSQSAESTVERTSVPNSAQYLLGGAQSPDVMVSDFPEAVEQWDSDSDYPTVSLSDSRRALAESERALEEAQLLSEPPSSESEGNDFQRELIELPPTEVPPSSESTSS